jgi:hypothetical protein
MQGSHLRGKCLERCTTEVLDICLCRKREEPTVDNADRLPDSHTVDREGVVREEPSSTSDELHTLQQGHNTTRPDCREKPPAKCLSPQCRGSDDGQTQTIPRCHRLDGLLVIKNTAVSLIECECCPEMVACDTDACQSDAASRICLSAYLKGCFYDWPAGGPNLVFDWDSPVPGIQPNVHLNEFDRDFDFWPSRGPTNKVLVILGRSVPPLQR